MSGVLGSVADGVGSVVDGIAGVLDGIADHLELDGAPLVVRAGELCVVPAGVPHAVSAGSHGTLLIIDS